MPGGGGADPGNANGHDLSFNTAAWNPDNREYGLFYLMVIREGLEPKKLAAPAEVENLKFMESRLINSHNSSAKPRGDNGDADEEADNAVEEGEPWEESEVAPWPGKTSSWWRVHASLGEELVVRSGPSLQSAELFRISPGDAVQQAGTARLLRNGRCRGCIRLPIKPRGWVTADATRAGGPRYVVSASAPRWRVVYSSPNASEVDAIIRSETALNSEEVQVLHCGDIVEQAGPSELRGQGIVRMPVTALILHRTDGDAEASQGKNSDAASARTLGWVTIDASSAGGPVFFKPAPDVDNKRRRRRPIWNS
jgi:hypothetical protein